MAGACCLHSPDQESNRLQAGDGGDEAHGGSGLDHISAGAGADLVNVADGERDIVDCAAGADEIIADRTDLVVHCETVTRV